MTLLAERNKLVRRIVTDEVNRYVQVLLNGHVSHPSRRCATCGGHFVPRQRYHFCCSTECRQEWYRGVFRPRTRPLD